MPPLFLVMLCIAQPDNSWLCGQRLNPIVVEMDSRTVFVGDVLHPNDPTAIVPFSLYESITYGYTFPGLQRDVYLIVDEDIISRTGLESDYRYLSNQACEQLTDPACLTP